LQKLDEKTIISLLCRAQEARGAAYAPYSGFRVGAALLCEDGSVFIGCNVENVSYGASNCAERTAVFAAVAAGNREFVAIAVAAGEELILPCGICRQVLTEFSPDILVICGKKDGFETFKLNELLPHGFNHFSAEEKI
jgi:cytidine deaminase